MRRSTSFQTLLLAVLLILLSSCLPKANAQNWAPLNLPDQFNFQLDLETVITSTIFVDSIDLTVGEPIYYLNRIVTECPTCQGFGHFMLANQPQFLMRKIILKAGGLWNFQDSANIALYTLAQQGATWLLDSSATVSATVDSIFPDSIFAQADSVKRILLSTGDTILLSKEHGILQWPDGYGSGIYHRLVGIKGRDLGKLLPGFSGMYDFQVGDVFQVSLGEYLCLGPPCDCFEFADTYKGTVDSIHQYWDTTEVYFHGLWVEYWGDACVGYSSGISPTVDSFIVVDTSDHFVHHYPNQLLSLYQRFIGFFDVGVSAEPMCHDISDYYDKCTYFDAGGGRVGMKAAATQQYGYHGFQAPGSPILAGGSGGADSIAYLEGMGLQYYGWVNFESSGFWRCDGYFNGTDTIGFLTPDSLLWIPQGIASPQSSLLIAYPNPTSGHLHLKWLDRGLREQAVIRLLALDGSVLDEVVMPMGFDEIDIDVSRFPAGIYLWEYLNASGVREVGRFAVTQ
jgi:hypothetical protein